MMWSKRRTISVVSTSSLRIIWRCSITEDCIRRNYRIEESREKNIGNQTGTGKSIRPRHWKSGQDLLQKIQKRLIADCRTVDGYCLVSSNCAGYVFYSLQGYFNNESWYGHHCFVWSYYSLDSPLYFDNKIFHKTSYNIA